ncbi:MAG: glutamate--tRNA ligase [Mycobacteriales bacterium]
MSTPRVRFAPSPTGDLHVGNVRTALYNWAYARRRGGVLVFRLEDTDRSRSSDEACAAAVETMRWLGLDWDEGVETGGPDGPYRQSERLDIYSGWTQRFLDEGSAYHCYCTQEEVAARAAVRGGPPGYDGYCRHLGSAQIASFRDQGRQPTVRLRMPEGETRFDDLIRGTVSFDNATVPDFVLVRADGHPLYTLAVVIDDALMRISHIIRGEDLLSSTPRQLAVYAAMGISPANWPQFAHLPMVLGPDGARLSKRNGVVSVAWYREQGVLAEALCNYLALLGWSPGEDREHFDLDELGRTFSLERVNHNPARFDMKKLESLNGDWIRSLSQVQLRARILPFLQRAGLVAMSPDAQQEQILAVALPLLQTRIRLLSEAPRLLGFLFSDDDNFKPDSNDAAQTLVEAGVGPLEAALAALEPLGSWQAESIAVALRDELDRRGMKTKVAFPPIYCAVTGYRSGLPLFDSLGLLGRDRVLRRLRAGLSRARGGERSGV